MRLWAAVLLIALAGVSAPAAPLPDRADFTIKGAATQGGVLLGTAPAGTVALTLDGKLVPVDGDGRFLIAFDRDAGPTGQLTARLADGRTLDHPIAIAPRAWRIA